MTIFYDPTEARKSSPIADQIKSLGKSMKGLEAATGCDIAVVSNGKLGESLLGNKEAEDIIRLLHSISDKKLVAKQLGVPLPEVIKVIRFWSAAYKNGILVQRKSGGDIIGSIPNLTKILEKMKLWTRRPWLLITGDIRSRKNGRMSMNDREYDMSYNAFQGALDAWQERGGFVSILSSDDDISPWLKRIQKKVNDVPPERVVYVRPAMQKIIGVDDDDAWVATLMTFKGIGVKMANEIKKTFGDLGTALCFLSDKDAHTYDFKPNGFGIITSKLARRRLGLTGSQRLMMVHDNDIALKQENKK